MSDFDVVVVGSGAAGLCAALEASDHGASVLVVDSEPAVGGSSRLSGGIIMASGSKLQASLGVSDTADDLFHDYMALNQWTVSPPLIRRLADESGPTVDWLAEQGVEFAEELLFSGEERQPRGHVPVGAGAGIVSALHSRCKERGTIDFALNHRVDRMLTESGRVVGVAAGDDEVRGRGVIVATGGFGANPELLASHFPRAAGDWSWYIGAQSSRGDAITLADQVGAQVTGENHGLLLFAPNFEYRMEAYLPGWLVIVNSQGRRFFNETAPYGVVEAQVLAQEGPTYAIFDEGAKRAAQPAGATAAKTRDIPLDSLDNNWVEPVIDEMLARGRIHRAGSLPELANAIGIPAEQLEGTVEGYNRGVAESHDHLYSKPAELMRPLVEPPYYGTEMRLRTICMTACGLQIDPDARVYDTRAQVIPGLYAAGECTGGVIGSIYIGSGNSYVNCVTFGRIAGRSAASVR